MAAESSGHTGMTHAPDPCSGVHEWNGPWAYTLSLASWQSWEQIKDMVLRLPTTRLPCVPVLQALAASASRLLISKLVSLLLHPCWCCLHGPGCNMALVS